MSGTEKYDTWGTDEIVCPWCGHVFSDSWEYNYDDDLVQCPECEKTLELEIEYSATYYTKKQELMPALSFQREFVDDLLRGDKQQTTRPQTDRFKVGDIAHIYIEQRRRITEKPLRTPTRIGAAMIFQMIEDEGRYPRPKCDASFGYSVDPYPAHFLGKVEITEVYERTFDITWIRRSEHEWRVVDAWARADGFKDFWDADTWFTARYGDDWMQRTWTVIRWNGWQERYFEAGEV